jgi:RNA recognition motif-containing protein
MSLTVRHGVKMPCRGPKHYGFIVNVVAAATQQGVGEMGKKLYVGNLAFEVTNKDLEELFAQAGICESVAVITDRATGQSRGFGFVEMGSNADAQKAIQQFDGHELKGRALKVNEARDREGGGGGGRGGGGGGRGGGGGGWNRRY